VLTRLSTQRLDPLYASLRERGMSPATFRMDHAVPPAALHQAVKRDMSAARALLGALVVLGDTEIPKQSP
jgi:hypothetical protein